MEQALNEQETLIFSSAESLFKISKDLIDIDPQLSRTILYLSDRVLRLIESAEQPSKRPNVGKPSSLPSSGVEICEDCGGIKDQCEIEEPSKIFKMPMTGSGGTRVAPQEEVSEKITPIQSDDEEIDESKLCHGHTGDGSGLDPNYKPGAQIINELEPRNNIKEEVRGLVDKIRKDLT